MLLQVILGLPAGCCMLSRRSQIYQITHPSHSALQADFLFSDSIMKNVLLILTQMMDLWKLSDVFWCSHCRWFCLSWWRSVGHDTKKTLNIKQKMKAWCQQVAQHLIISDTTPCVQTESCQSPELYLTAEWGQAFHFRFSSYNMSYFRPVEWKPPNPHPGVYLK